MMYLEEKEIRRVEAPIYVMKTVVPRISLSEQVGLFDRTFVQMYLST